MVEATNNIWEYNPSAAGQDGKAQADTLAYGWPVGTDGDAKHGDASKHPKLPANRPAKSPASKAGQVMRIRYRASNGRSKSETVNVDASLAAHWVKLARGTMIETDKGPKHIEALKVGDLVKTRDGSNQPIRWIGSSLFNNASLSDDDRLHPVQIPADAMGKGLPRAALTVSSHQHVAMNDWRCAELFGSPDALVPVSAVVGHTKAAIKPAHEIEYFNLVFDAHQIFFANGLPVEAFHPGKHARSVLTDAAQDAMKKVFPHHKSLEDFGKRTAPALKKFEADVLFA